MTPMESIRKAAGFGTQSSVARIFKVERITISRWESGERAPKPEVIKRLADLYGVTTDDIIAAITEEKLRRQGATVVGGHGRTSPWIQFPAEQRLPAEQTKIRGA